MSYTEQKYSIVNESFFGDEVGNDELESSIDSGENFEKSELPVNEQLYFTLVLQTECNYCGDCFTLRQALEYKTSLMSEYSRFLDKIESQMMRILSALDMDDKVIFRYLVRNCTVYDDVFDEMEIFGRNCLVQPCGLDTENMFEIYVYI